MNRTQSISSIFHAEKPIIGMLHLGGFGADGIRKRAKAEISDMYKEGVNAILVENYFGSLNDVEWALKTLQDHHPDKVYGINILGDYTRAFELAERYGAAFLQIDSVCGHLPTERNGKLSADEQYTMRLEQFRSASSVFVLGGVRFKYQSVRSGRSLEEDLRIGMERCDAIVVTGSGTGQNTDISKIREFRSIMGSFPLIVGAGMTEQSCTEQLSVADGAIVGSWFKFDGVTENPVDPDRVHMFMRAVQQLRQNA